MGLTFGAFYIPKEKSEEKTPDPKAVQKSGNLLSQAVQTAKDKIKNFDVKTVAKNITLQSATEWSQKYAVGALSNIINGEPVTSQKMLDGLFNGLAPAMDLTAFQTGYNSLASMKTAVQGGNINVATFLNGFQSALSLVEKNKKVADYSKYGEEIKIDLTLNLSHQYISETCDRRVEAGQTYNEFVHNLPDVIPFSGMIKDGKNYTCDEFCDLLVEVRDSLRPFIFRAGKKIYENYVFQSFIPMTATEGALNFTAEIKKIESGEIELVKVDIPRPVSRIGSSQKRIQKTNPIKGQNIKNVTQKQKYVGAMRLREFATGNPVYDMPSVDAVLNWQNSFK